MRSDHTKALAREIAEALARQNLLELRAVCVGPHDVQWLPAEQQSAAIIAEKIAPLVEALKLCHHELRFMLNNYPERKGGAYERAYRAAHSALTQIGATNE